MTGRRIRVGVIGLGRVAQLHHLPHLAGSARAELSAVCDLSQSLAVQVGASYGLPDGTVATSAEDLLSRELDAVLIANRHHGPIVAAALDAGLHVFVEKPVCWGLAEGQALRARERAAGAAAVVGYMKRYDPAFLRLQAAKPEPILVRLSVFGGARHKYEKLQTRIKGDEPEPSSAETLEIDGAIAASLPDDDFVADVRLLAELSIHDLNLARALLGPLSVQGATRFPTPFGTGYLVQLAAAGTPVTLEVVPDFETARDWDETLTVFTASATTELRFGSPFLRSAPTILQESYVDGIQVIRQEVIPSQDSPYRRELEHFLDCALGLAEPITPISDAVEDLELVYAIVRVLRDLEQ